MNLEVVRGLDNDLIARIGAKVDRGVALRLDVDILKQLQRQRLDVDLVEVDFTRIERNGTAIIGME